MDINDRSSSVPQKPYKSLEDTSAYVSPKLSHEGRVVSNLCKKIYVTFNQVKTLLTEGKWVNDNSVKKRLNNNFQVLNKDIAQINSKLTSDTSEATELMQNMDDWTNKIAEMKDTCRLLQQSGSTSAEGMSQLLDALEITLKEQQKGLQQKVNKQSNKIPISTNEGFLAQQAVSFAQAKVTETEEQLRESEANMEKLVQERNNAEAHIKNLEQQIKALQNPTTENVVKVAELNEEEISNLNAQLSDTQNEVTNLKKEIEAATVKSKKRDELLAEKQTDLQKVQQEVADLKKEIDEVPAKLQKRDDMLAEKQNELQKAEEEAAKLKNEIQEATIKSQNGEKQLAEKQKELEGLQDEVSGLKKEIAEVPAKLQKRDDILAEKQNELQKAEEEAAKLKNEIQEATIKSQNGEKQLAEKQKELEGLQEEVSGLKNKINSAQIDSKKWESDHEALLKEFNEFKENTLTEKNVVNQLKEEMSNLNHTNKQKIQEQEEKLKKVKIKLEEAKKTLTENQEKLEKAEDDFNKAVSRFGEIDESYNEHLKKINTARDAERGNIGAMGLVKKAFQNKESVIRETLSREIVSLIDEAYKVEGFEASLGQKWAYLGMASNSTENTDLRNFQKGFQTNIQKFTPNQLKESFNEAENLIKKGLEQLGGTIPQEIEAQLQSIRDHIDNLDDIDHVNTLSKLQSDKLGKFQTVQAKLKAEKAKTAIALELTNKVSNIIQKVSGYRETRLDKIGPDTNLAQAQEVFLRLKQHIEGTDNVGQFLERNIDKIVGNSIKVIERIKSEYPDAPFDLDLDDIHQEYYELLKTVKPTENSAGAQKPAEISKKQEVPKADQKAPVGKFVEVDDSATVKMDADLFKTAPLERETIQSYLSAELKEVISMVTEDENFRSEFLQFVFPNLEETEDLEFLRRFKGFEGENNVQKVKDTTKRIIGIIEEGIKNNQDLSDDENFLTVFNNIKKNADKYSGF